MGERTSHAAVLIHSGENEMDQKQFEAIKEELKSFPGEIAAEFPDLPEQTKTRLGWIKLEDRAQRGLDVIGIVALDETREKAMALSQKIEVPFEKVLEITVNIQTGGPWEYADKLANGEDEAKVWLMLKSTFPEREMDMTSAEFLEHVKQVNKFLDQALEDPDYFFEQAKQKVVSSTKSRFRIEKGVPITEKDNGFIDIAVNGHHAGIYHDADGMLHVGAKFIDDEIFKAWGLKSEIRENRGRKVNYWINNKGEAVLKKLYPGYVIIESRSFDLAKALVESVNSGKAVPISEEVLGHAVYRPTSLDKGHTLASDTHNEENDSAMKRILKPTYEHEIEPTPSEGTEIVRSRDLFYMELARVKSTVSFLDAVELARKKAAEQGREFLDDDFDRLSKKRSEKIQQKIDELRYMMTVIDKEFKALPEGEHRVMDMAGGAGDLGLVITNKMLSEGMPLKEMVIVDPVEELVTFTNQIVEHLPMHEEVQAKVKRDMRALQEVTIGKDDIVVAKHACGDLTDTIIDNWVHSESPLLVMMTCCQDKAKDKPARYDISQPDWVKWCRDSTKTNSDDPKKKKIGMDAMIKLDEARVRYLSRYGFEVNFYQTDQFPKGDVIVARRKPNQKEK